MAPEHILNECLILLAQTLSLHQEAFPRSASCGEQSSGDIRCQQQVPQAGVKNNACFTTRQKKKSSISVIAGSKVIGAVPRDSPGSGTLTGKRAAQHPCLKMLAQRREQGGSCTLFLAERSRGTEQGCGHIVPVASDTAAARAWLFHVLSTW